MRLGMRNLTFVYRIGGLSFGMLVEFFTKFLGKIVVAGGAEMLNGELQMVQPFFRVRLGMFLVPTFFVATLFFDTFSDAFFAATFFFDGSKLLSDRLQFLLQLLGSVDLPLFAKFLGLLMQFLGAFVEFICGLLVFSDGGEAEDRGQCGNSAGDVYGFHIGW